MWVSVVPQNSLLPKLLPIFAKHQHRSTITFITFFSYDINYEMTYLPNSINMVILGSVTYESLYVSPFPTVTNHTQCGPIM